MGNLVLGYRDAGKLDRELPKQGELASLWKQKAGANSPEHATALRWLGLIQLESRTWAQAESTLRECLAIRELRQPDNWATFDTRSVLGGALLGQKGYNEAEPLLRTGYAGMASVPTRSPCVTGPPRRGPRPADFLRGGDQQGRRCKGLEGRAGQTARQPSEARNSEAMSIAI